MRRRGRREGSVCGLRCVRCRGSRCAAAKRPPTPNRPPLFSPRETTGYYSGEEDAFDMRKAMPRDVDRKSVVPLTRDVHPHELDFD